MGEVLIGTLLHTTGVPFVHEASFPLPAGRVGCFDGGRHPAGGPEGLCPGLCPRPRQQHRGGRAVRPSIGLRELATRAALPAGAATATSTAHVADGAARGPRGETNSSTSAGRPPDASGTAAAGGGRS